VEILLEFATTTQRLSCQTCLRDQTTGLSESTRTPGKGPEAFSPPTALAAGQGARPSLTKKDGPAPQPGRQGRSWIEKIHRLASGGFETSSVAIEQTAPIAAADAQND
jgi:hypothetical protein